MHPELGEDVGHVVALGADRDVEPVGDRLALEPVGERLQDLALAGGQSLDRQAVCALALAYGLDPPPRTSVSSAWTSA